MADLIGERIAALRKQRKLSIRKLASLAQMSPGNLAAILNGNRQGGNLTVLSAKRLARALGVSLDHLVGMYEADEDEEPEAEGRAA